MVSYIVGLDLSLTSAGIAVLSTDTPARGSAGCYPTLLRCVGEAGKKDDDYRTRSRRIRRQTRAVVDTVNRATGFDGVQRPDISLAVIEGPIYGMQMLGAYFDRAALFHGVYGALDARNIPIAVIPPTTGHQFTTGVAHADKKLIVAEVAKWWPDVRIANDDIADALGYALMGAMHSGLRPPFRAGARHHNAIASASWPFAAPRRAGLIGVGRGANG